MPIKKKQSRLINTSSRECDFCRSSALMTAYIVPESERKSEVLVCMSCGLVQSRQSNKRIAKRVHISSQANWGNIRVGKSLRFQHAKPILEGFLKISQLKTVIDIGSNRGDIVLWLREHNSLAQITAIEPDTSLTDPYKDEPKITVISKRFEQVELPKECFDLAICFHTLEHVLSARDTLFSIWKSLKVGGYLFLEVPNIEYIAESDIVEEFFIDKHVYHFHSAILKIFLQQLGFDIIYGPDNKDPLNITFLLRKRLSGEPNFVPEKTNLPQRMVAMIKQYKETLYKNRLVLSKVGTMLNAFMKRQKVVFWGAGRIYDALVTYGKLEVSSAAGLIDMYLVGKIGSLHGLNISDENLLRKIPVDVVVILAKSSTSEIEKLVRKFGSIHVIKFSDLLVTAKTI